MNLRDLQPYVIGWIRDYLTQALAGPLAPFSLTVRDLTLTAQFTPHTPALNLGPAVLSGYDECRYFRIGPLVAFKFSCMARSLSGSAGAIGISLPVAGRSKVYALDVNVIWTGAGSWRRVRADLSGSTLSIYKDTNVTNWLSTETGLYLEISGFYEPSS